MHHLEAVSTSIEGRGGLTARTAMLIATSGLWLRAGDGVGHQDLGPDRDGDRAWRGTGRAQARASASRDSAGAGDAAPVWARGHPMAQPEGDTDPGQRLDPASPALADWAAINLLHRVHPVLVARLRGD